MGEGGCFHRSWKLSLILVLWEGWGILWEKGWVWGALTEVSVWHWHCRLSACDLGTQPRSILAWLCILRPRISPFPHTFCFGFLNLYLIREGSSLSQFWLMSGGSVELWFEDREEIIGLHGKLCCNWLIMSAMAIRIGVYRMHARSLCFCSK